MAAPTNQTLEHQENLIALMALYRQEWQYRDQNANSLLWRFAYLSLITIFFPYVLEQVGVDQSAIRNIPSWAFSCAGIALALLGLYISVGLIKRIESIDTLYKTIMKKLPPDCRLPTLHKTTHGKYFMPRLSYVLCFSIFIIVIALAIINLVYSR